MSRIPVLLASIGGALLSPSFADAADFQEGRFLNCTSSSICRLNFAGPGAGGRLRLEHITCRLRTSESVDAWAVDLFDGNNALYLPMVRQDFVAQSFAGAAPVMFFTGGAAIAVTANLGAATSSELACTLTGQTF